MSVLNKDRSPHPPHSHEEEEILLLLRGEVDLVLTDEKSPGRTRRMSLKPGQFVYYPAQFAHTLQTVSEQPAYYMMFKWQNDAKEKDSPLKFSLFDLFGHEDESDAGEGFQLHLVFQGSTDYLRKLHCHTSTLIPGAGYDPHFDTYDVAILILEGEVETIGKRAGPQSLIFYPAGEPHGMYNPGETAARYVVFEFHSRQKGLTAVRLKYFLSLLVKAKDPQRWKKLLEKLLSSHKK
jgi:quercetin dioxygenase-like cupin family protein